jgi:hypothetical protein
LTESLARSAEPSSCAESIYRELSEFYRIRFENYLIIPTEQIVWYALHFRDGRGVGAGVIVDKWVGHIIVEVSNRSGDVKLLTLLSGKLSGSLIIAEDANDMLELRSCI